MLETGRRCQQTRDLVGAEHNREFARVAQADQLAGETGRLTVWLKKKRRAATVLFMAGAFMPRSDC